jgi:endonuclease/exonuclease/phosphatase (EEP) superfamily protein YafD
MAACQVIKTDMSPLQAFDSSVATLASPTACLSALRQQQPEHNVGFNRQRIRVLSWNLQKAHNAEALYQLGILSSGMDLVSIQEATLNDSMRGRFPNLPAWSFGPGYRTNKDVTGVMNLSRFPALTHCVFASTEPWLRTPKATSVTEYPLAGGSGTLLLVNVHGVNFTFTASALVAQLEQFSAMIDSHDGPVILSGDFNTWSDARLEALQRFAAKHRLELLDFDVDHRKTVFGNPLDHVLVRGLTVLDTGSYEVDTSDHNVLRVELRVTEAL